MRYRHVLITGGAGFIGSHLTDHLVTRGYTVRILDNLNPQIHPSGRPPMYLNPKAEFIKGDVTVYKDWQKALSGIDCVFHLASAVGVGQSMYEVEHYVKTNSWGTAVFLDILANEKHTVKKMLIAASMSSYGEGVYRCTYCSEMKQPDLRNKADLTKGIWEPLCSKCHHQLSAVPTNEEAQLKGPSVYAITKKNQEELMIAIGKAYDIPTVSLRFFNVYGSRQSLSNPYTGVTAIFFSRVKNGQPPLINEDGLQTRDFIHVSDIVSALTLSLEEKNSDYQIFNIGSGIPISIRKVAEEIISYFGSDVKLEITRKFRVADVRHCYADITKIKKTLGWRPKVLFAEGIKDVFIWSKREKAQDLVDQAMSELAKRGLR